jgi:hypothetical protein
MANNKNNKAADAELKQGVVSETDTSGKDGQETPEKPKGNRRDAEVKQGVFDPNVKVKVKVPGLTGNFSGAIFGSDNITTEPVTQEVFQKVLQVFGDAAEVVQVK